MDLSNGFVSLFSGCGGFDLGFERAGFLGKGAFDLDQDAVDNYRGNISSEVYRADLKAGIPGEERFRGIPALIAGPPCQGFSTVGRRMLNDHRNHLLPLVGSLAIRVKPKVVVVENVTGVLSGEHRKYWTQLNEMLREGGYKTHSLTCHTVDLGLPQNRRRVILLAWCSGQEPNFILPKLPKQTLRSALTKISGLPNHTPRLLTDGSEAQLIAKRIKPNQKLSNVRGGPRSIHTWDIPEVFGETTANEKTLLEILLRLRRQNRVREVGDADPVSHARLAAAFGQSYTKLVKSLTSKGYIRRRDKSLDLVHTFNGKFRRLDWDAPSCTVDTRFGQARYFLHPEYDRGFTVREAARLQGFPDSYVFKGRSSSHFRLIGNAVPPVVGEFTGKYAAYLSGKLS